MGKTRKQLGFGLAEVLLASGILIMVVASVVSLSRFVIRGYAVTLSRTQALYLAQEGLERVRNIRDTFWIDGDPTTDFADLSNGVYTSRWNSSSRRWELVGGTETISGLSVLSFRREIRIANANLGDAQLDPHTKRITVTVSWDESGRTWSASSETLLTNWKPEA